MATRREVLIAAQAPLFGGSAGFIAGTVVPEAWKADAAAREEPSEIMRLLRECIAQRERYDLGRFSDEESDAEFAKLRALEIRMASIPAKTVEELAAKVLVWTAYAGPDEVQMDYDLDKPILAEVRQLTGCTWR